MKLPGHNQFNFLKIAQDMGQPPSDEPTQEPAQVDPAQQELDNPPQLTDQEKWDMFDKYVKLLEESKIGKQQLEDSKNTLEQLIWGTINKPA